MDVPSVLLNAIDTVKQILGEKKEVLASGGEIIKSILGLTLNTPIDFINIISYTFLARQIAEELRKKLHFFIILGCFGIISINFFMVAF